MKKITRLVNILLLAVLSNSVLANAPTYLQSPKKFGYNTSVYVVNQTRESYMVYATYQGSYRNFNLPLDKYPHDIIEFPILYPDYSVCMKVVQDYTNQVAYNGCAASGSIYIHYLADNKTIAVNR